MKRMLGVAALAVTGFGCSSSTSSTINTDAGNADAGLTAEQACTDNAHANCSLLESCSPTDVQIRYGDQQTCEANQTSNCLAAIAAPSTGNDPSKTEGCAMAYASWACSDFLSDLNTPRACQTATGALGSGAPCAYPGQCATGFCAIAPGSACGVCAAPPSVGASCASLTTCGPGLVCTTDTHTCVVFAGTGAPCGKGAPCVSGQSCVGANATAGTMGTCQPAVEQSGAACDPTQRTAAGCDRNAGLACNSATKQCAAVTVADAGQPCNDVDDQGTPCGGGGQCSTSTAGMTGTCTGAAALGGACDIVNGPGCVAPVRCIVTSDAGTAGTCQIPDPAGCL